MPDPTPNPGPMEDDTTVTMPAYADPPVLPWETRQEYHLAWVQGDLHAFAYVMQLKYLSDLPEGGTWRAHCTGPRVPGPEPTEFDGWFATAEEAIAAVELHIAGKVDAHLSEVAR